MFPLGAMTISSYWCGKNVKVNEKLGWAFMKYGLITMSAPLVFLIFFSSLGYLMFFISVSFGGLGLMLPVINTFINGSVLEHDRGMVVSLYGSVRFTGVALGPIAYSLWRDDPTHMYAITFGFSLLNIVLFVFLVFRKGGEFRPGI